MRPSVHLTFRRCLRRAASRGRERRVDRISRLFENHHDALYRYLVRLSGDADLAADAAQETFVRLFEQPPDAVIERAWLFKVGTNLVFERARTASRRERLLFATGERTMADPPRD